VANRDTYIRPHRHPQGKDESYYVVEGEMVVFIFDDSGQVVRHFDMGEFASGKTVLYRLSSNLWHLPVPLTEWVVYHEVFTGPFQKERDVEYAPWSPPETDVPAVVITDEMLGQLQLPELSRERAKRFERLVNNFDGAVYTGTESTRVSEYNLHILTSLLG
jgi:cupin fold WbuC family metalloprotein